MTALRDQVVAAFEQGDQVGVKRVGWWDVWEACATWWAPKQTATAKDMVPFAKLLGDEDPAKVLEALRELAGEWRPHPAAVRSYLHRPRDPQTNAGLSRDRAGTADAINAVVAAHEAGERVCSCEHHHSVWLIDGAGVLRCTVCQGLEQGQWYAAEDAGLIREAA